MFARRIFFLVLSALLLAGTLSAQSGVRPLHEEPLGDVILDPAAMKVLSELTAPASCLDGKAAATFSCRGVTLQSFVSLDTMLSNLPGSSPALSGSALWGFASKNDGREYAIFGASAGTAVVDVTDPARPAVIGSVAGLTSPWREVKVFQVFNPVRNRYDAYAYVVSEAVGSGIQILDLSDLPRSARLATTSHAIARAHTVYLAK